MDVTSRLLVVSSGQRGAVSSSTNTRRQRTTHDVSTSVRTLVYKVRSLFRSMASKSQLLQSNTVLALHVCNFFHVERGISLADNKCISHLQIKFICPVYQGHLQDDPHRRCMRFRSHRFNISRWKTTKLIGNLTPQNKKLSHTMVYVTGLNFYHHITEHIMSVYDRKAFRQFRRWKVDVVLIVLNFYVSSVFTSFFALRRCNMKQTRPIIHADGTESPISSP